MITPEEQQQVDRAYQERSKDNPMLFLKGLTIPSASGEQMFSRCIQPFQEECLVELTESLKATRAGVKPPQRRFWWERTKKASKDGDIGASLLWLAAFADRPILIQVGAADRDQAGIVRNRIEAILHYNDWLREYVQVNNYKVNGSGGARLEIVAADVSGSHGATPDVLVLNELSHVTKWEFIENMLDNARGVPHSIILIATNAGFKGTKAEVLRKNAIQSKYWSVHILDKPAPWISEEDLEEAKQASKSKTRYRRLWWGEWASGKGDAVDEDRIDLVFKPDLHELVHPEKGWQYVMGLDLGVKHDHCGLAVVGVNYTYRRLRVASLRSFVPPGGGREIDLDEVENVGLGLCRAFRAAWFGYDPHQAVLMAQRLRKQGLPMQEMPFVPANLVKMADAFLQVTKEGVLESFESDELRRDFGKFNIVEKSYGYRLEATSDEYGHADVGTALLICLPKAIEMLDAPLFSEDDVIATDEELEEEDIDEMPDELKAIYEMYTDRER